MFVLYREKKNEYRANILFDDNKEEIEFIISLHVLLNLLVFCVLVLKLVVQLIFKLKFYKSY